MNDQERAQVERIVAHELKAARSDIQTSTESIYRKQSAAGMLASGNTVVAIIDELKARAGGLAKALNDKVRPVASDREAFEAVSWGVLSFLEACEKQIPRLMAMMGGGETERFKTAAIERMEAAFLDIRAKREIATYDYQNSTGSTEALTSASSVNRGGRPRGAYSRRGGQAGRRCRLERSPRIQAGVSAA